MANAAWILGMDIIRGNDIGLKRLALLSSFFILPWMLISVFAGMGPPPSTIEGYVALAAEQQTRYFILVTSGVFITFGFALLRDIVKKAGEDFYSQLGYTAILMAIPLFIINMLFWGCYLTESFPIFIAAGSDKRPDWYLPVRKLFESISVIEVALTYLATMAFAASLKKAMIFQSASCNVYIVASMLGFVLCAIPSFTPQPLAAAGFAASIPAIPFVMPYLMGINLLRISGIKKARPLLKGNSAKNCFLFLARFLL